jgi:multiple sugar transport system ATP-binding protein
MSVVPAPAIGVGREGQLAGFRPEHIRLGGVNVASVGFDAVVEVVEYLGDEQLAHLRLGEKTLVAKLPVSVNLEVGTRESFAVQLEDIVLFDSVSGEAIAWGVGSASMLQPAT